MKGPKRSQTDCFALVDGAEIARNRVRFREVVLKTFHRRDSVEFCSCRSNERARRESNQQVAGTLSFTAIERFIIVPVIVLVAVTPVVLVIFLAMVVLLGPPFIVAHFVVIAPLARALAPGRRELDRSASTAVDGDVVHRIEWDFDIGGANAKNQ